MTARPRSAGDGDGDGGRIPFHVLREYALLADGERGAVLGPDGALVWMCFPSWHSDAVFSALVGGVGHYAVTPEAPYVWGGHYEPASLIWRSRWVTADGVTECREALVAPGRRDRAVLLRRLVGTRGTSRVRVELALRSGYGRNPVHDLRHDERGQWLGVSGGVHFRWSGAPEATVRADGRCELQVTLTEHETRDLVLELDEVELGAGAPDVEELWQQTEHHWAATVPAFEHLDTRRDARHACAVLGGMTSSSGGMVASATTSLPERAGAGRSYDYRYVWIRDQSYAGVAFATAGAESRMDPVVGFVAERLLADGAQLAPVYTIDGERPPSEVELGLPGYPGGSDVIGNRAREQFQLDVFGEALSLFAAADGAGRLSVDGWRAAEIAVEAIATRRAEPDAGIWELEPRRWTHSRLACVAGLRAISQAPGAPHRRRSDWMALADTMLTEATRTCLHPTGRWQRAPDDPAPDAALLVAAIRGAVPADDPRSLATHRAVAEELGREGYVYRFRHDSRPLHEAEGAFLLCGFWMALSSVRQGRTADARSWFERTRAACGPPGLYSEEFDVEQRQLRGNLPQAFVHALLLECAAVM